MYENSYIGLQTAIGSMQQPFILVILTDCQPKRVIRYNYGVLLAYTEVQLKVT
jgi:hypothetical protein